MITTREDPVVFEVTTTLREWHKIWLSLYLDDQNYLFETIGNIIEELIDLRAELILSVKHFSLSQEATGGGGGSDNSCTYVSREQQQIYELKSDITNKIDYGNRLLNLDLVPRGPDFKVVDPIELSPVKLYQVHSEAACNSSTYGSLLNGNNNNSISNNCNNNYGCHGSIISSTLSTSSFRSSDSSASSSSCQNSYHLQMSLRSQFLASLPPDELVEVYFSVVEVSNSGSPTVRLVTEKFLVQIMNDEVFGGVPNTIFVNLGQMANRDINLLIQVYRIGKMTLVDGYKTTFGKQTSSLELTTANLDGSTNSLTGATRYTPNGLSRSRQSTIGTSGMVPRYKRPFGNTMIPLKEYTKLTNFRETTINVKVLAASEVEFSMINELSSKRNHSIRANQNLANIQLNLSLRFISCQQESLSKLSSAKPYCLTEKRGFPDIVMPGDFKNDLYFTLENAEFEKGGKSIPKNIEASISLIDKSGLVIRHSISPASNCDNLSTYRSCVYYHSNSPKWNESIKINVPLVEFDSSHIRIEFRHCSTKDRDKKFLGFSFLPLSDQDGTVIADKTHELYLYKCDSQIWEDESLNLCKYSSLPYGPEDRSQRTSKTVNLNSNFTHSSREIVTVSTFLLSTKLTQNSNLLNLLKWRELIKRDSREFEEALKKVLVLKGEEIVKFLQDILDTLFDTFTLYSTSEDDYCALIFKVLVHIFLLLDEPKYQHFKPVLDTYASAHFSATLVYKGLLACIKKCLEYSSNVERHVPIQRCFKSIRYVFLFIVQSKLLYSKATGEHNDQQFLNDIRHLFKVFGIMLANSNTHLIPLQVTFLESFPGTLDQLQKVISPKELAMVVTSLAGSVGFSKLPSSLSKAKLVFMKETANSSLLKMNPEVRMDITQIFCRHLDYYIKHSIDLEQSFEVLEILIVRIHDHHWPSIYRAYRVLGSSITHHNARLSCPLMTVGEIDNLIAANQASTSQKIHMSPSKNQISLGLINSAISRASEEIKPFVILLDPLLKLLDSLAKDFNTDSLLFQKYHACLLTVLKLMSNSNFDQFRKVGALHYQKMCDLFGSLRAIYNRDWSVMELTSHSILEHPINEFFRDIETITDPYPQNRQILCSYVKLILEFIVNPTIQLESFSARKKAYVVGVFGDLRIKFAAQLMHFWSNLKPREVVICDLIPSSLQYFLDAALQPNEDLQQMLIPVFWDMIDAEDSHRTNSRQFERCLMDNIDTFFNHDKGNTRFINNFENILTRMMKERNPKWEQRGMNAVSSITNLMNLLIDYRDSIEIPYENRSRQMDCLVKLLNFYKDQGRVDLHLKYLFKLSEIHLEVLNYVEAAFTLKLYTDEMKFCDKNLNAVDGFCPEEQEWHRKEQLYLRIIDYFDVGKCWEEAIPLCKDLASFYENFLVDYGKLANTLRRFAQFLDNILATKRPEREYFKVEFLGSDLPKYVKGKEFIYRGGEYERLADFMQKMSAEFPDARVLNPISKQAITSESPGQYMFISSVKSRPIQEHLRSETRSIDDKIVQYYLHNRIETFSYDIPITKGTNSKDKSSSVVNVRNTWVGRYLLKTEKQLPGILPWSQIISQEFIEINPVDHAIETISKMNLELTNLIMSYKKEPNQSISNLTMRLQGIIEAAVNGGPSVFINAFLKRRPEKGPNSYHDAVSLIRLHNAIKQQFSLLDMGLELHSKLVPPEVRPLHERLNERLQSIKKDLAKEPTIKAQESNEIVKNETEIDGRQLNETDNLVDKFNTGFE